MTISTAKLVSFLYDKNSCTLSKLSCIYFSLSGGLQSTLNLSSLAKETVEY